MKIMYKGCSSDTAVIDEITAEIATRLTIAEGEHARLLDTNPEIMTYTSSFFLRFPIELANGQKSHILVKIRRHPKMATLSEAISATNLHIKMPEEYQALQSTYEYFGRRSDGLNAARPLAYLNAFHALVMFEFPGATLRQLLMAGARHFGSGTHTERLHTAANSSGKWLQEFHSGMNDATTQSYSADEFHDETASILNKLGKHGVPTRQVDQLSHLFDRAIEHLGVRDVTFSKSHEDYTTDNILFDPSDQLAVIDIKIRPAPAYLDLALLLVHPETYRAQFLSAGAYFSGKKLRGYRDSIMEGYFAGSAPDRLLLDFYCAKNILGKWLMYENIMRNHKGVKAVMSSLIKPQLRHYFSKTTHAYLRSARD